MNEALIRQTLAANPIKQLVHGGAAEACIEWKNEMVLIKRANGFYFCYLLVPEQRTVFGSRLADVDSRRLGLGTVYWIQGCTVR